MFRVMILPRLRSGLRTLDSGLDCGLCVAWVCFNKGASACATIMSEVIVISSSHSTDTEDDESEGFRLGSTSTCPPRLENYFKLKISVLQYDCMFSCSRALFGPANDSESRYCGIHLL